MALENPRDDARRFAKPPMVVGAALVAFGLLVAGFGLVASEPSPMYRIVGFAMAIVGSFAFGFGLLVRTVNKSPRENSQGPRA